MFTLNTLNVRLSQSPVQLLAYGVAIYRNSEEKEIVVPIQESGDGTHSFWSDPQGELHIIRDVTALLNQQLLQSAKHGNKGRDSKGALYGNVTVTLTTDSGQLIAFKGVYLPHESDAEHDVFRFIGNPRNSRFAAHKFGLVK